MNPLEFLYYAGYSFKKRLTLARRRKLPYAVISIGNITVGGTGKTPAAIAIAGEAAKRGFSPVILTRGYRGRAKGPCLVSASGTLPENFRGDLHKVVCSVRDSGDEPVLMAGRLKGVPVIKSADRYEGGIFAIRSLAPADGAPFLFILDDGFQHWGLERDVDIVLINGLNPFGNGKMLPSGTLREPPGELRRADIFVINRNGEHQDTGKPLPEGLAEKPVYFSGYEIVRALNKAAAEYSAEALRGRRVFAFCGIAHPESFMRSLSSLGIDLAGFKAYRDHHFYTQSDLDRLARQGREQRCDLMLTTEKDMVKLKELELPDTVFSLEGEWSADPAFYEDVFKRADECMGKKTHLPIA